MNRKQHFRVVLAGSLALVVLSLTPALHSQTARRSRPSASPDVRSAFATTMERQMRAQGTDVRVQLAGDSRDTLQVEWPAVRRSDIYGFVTSPAVQQALRMGFSTVVVTNGSRRWEYNLTQESMISSPDNS
jgi:hypothetical protein